MRTEGKRIAAVCPGCASVAHLALEAAQSGAPWKCPSCGRANGVDSRLPGSALARLAAREPSAQVFGESFRAPARKPGPRPPAR